MFWGVSLVSPIKASKDKMVRKVQVVIGLGTRWAIQHQGDGFSTGHESKKGP